MQSKHQPTNVNETVNLVNGEKNMKFNQEESTAIENFTKAFYRIIAAYEDAEYGLENETKISNDNNLFVHLHGGYTYLYLQQNKDSNRREYRVSIYVEEDILFPDPGIIFKSIEEALDAVLEFHDEHIAARLDINPIIKRSTEKRTVRFDRIQFDRVHIPFDMIDDEILFELPK